MADALLRSIALAAPSGTGGPERILNTLVNPPVTVRDGERWTAFDLGGLSLALAAPEELPPGAKASLNIKVDDVPAAFDRLVAAGAKPASRPATGTHEERASVWLSEGVALSVYRSLPG
jgi:hypothetical protein